MQEAQPRKRFSLSRKSVKRLMNDETVTPPARVWNSIEKILDKQDAGKKARKLIDHAKSRHAEYAAAVTVLAMMVKLVK